MKKLIEHAINARTNAYTPYSNFNVGAALLMKDGKVITGSNVENASYGLSNCAERSALFSAYSQGYKKDDIAMMAIAGDTKKAISPCGACRQVMHELINDDVKIYLTNLTGDIVVTSTKELLPYAFSEVENE